MAPAALLAAALLLLLGASPCIVSQTAGGVTFSSPSQLPLGEVKLPPGFSIALYTNASLPDARAMVLSGASNASATIVYLSTPGEGAVQALVERPADGKAGSMAVCTLLKGMDNPEGLLWDNGSLFVFETTTLRRFDNVDAAVLGGCEAINPASGAVLVSSFPQQSDHAARNMVLGPDGYIYVVVGSPANVADCVEVSGVRQCSIMRLRPDGSDLQVFASGVRNVVGLTVDPSGQKLFFAELARDLLGDDRPDDLLRSQPLATAPVAYGYPFCHWVGQGPPELRSLGPGFVIPDDQKVPPEQRVDAAAGPPAPERNATVEAYCQRNAVPPLQAMGPHLSPLGLKFASSAAFPPAYSGDRVLLLAEHGSWNRAIRIGYRLALVQLDASGRPARHEVFASGWLRAAGTLQASYWGRPAHLLFLPDGSLLVSDDYAGAVYRIAYAGDGAARAG